MSDSKKKSAKKARGKAAKKLARLEKQIETSRHDVSHALDVLRLGAHRELSFLPKGEKWLLPSVAFALGLALSGGGQKSTPYTAPSRVDPADDASADEPEDASESASERKD